MEAPMSTDTERQPDVTDHDDEPFDAVREREDALEALAAEDSRLGAVAEYLLAIANGERPSPAVCRQADLPDPRDGETR